MSLDRASQWASLPAGSWGAAAIRSPARRIAVCRVLAAVDGAPGEVGGDAAFTVSVQRPHLAVGAAAGQAGEVGVVALVEAAGEQQGRAGDVSSPARRDRRFEGLRRGVDEPGTGPVVRDHRGPAPSPRMPLARPMTT